MNKTYQQFSACNCAAANTMALIGGKWKVIILDELRQKPYHFNELQRKIDSITAHTLSQTLKELINDKLVTRYDKHSNPPQTEYWLSHKGKELTPILEEIVKFGEGHPLSSKN